MSQRSHEERLEYLLMTDEVSREWLKVFSSDPNDRAFWDLAYWDLLTRLWRTNRKVKKTEAMGFIAGKTAPTSAKYLATALESGFITEERNEDDPRSLLIGLSEEMQGKLDAFFDLTLDKLKETAEKVR